MPTGGINLKNAPDYLSYEKIWAVGGSWIAKKDDISAGNFEKIKLNAEEAVALVKAIRP